jgi:hypothetical protein
VSLERTREPLQISTNKGSHLRQWKTKNSWTYKQFFKTGSSSKEALLKTLKHLSSILEIYKERNFVGSSLNAPKEFFNNTLNTNQMCSLKYQITKSCSAIHAKIHVLVKHKSWINFTNKSIHHISNPREELEDCLILL